LDTRKYREFMIKKVLPSIKLKWPDWDHVIIIQQDSASSDGIGSAICDFPRENEELQLEQELCRQNDSKIGTT
jgi:hypothetical protein